jgi:hypothetical protein
MGYYFRTSRGEGLNVAVSLLGLGETLWV